MIYQDVFLERVLIVFTLQFWPIIYFSIFVIILSKREKTKLTQLLIWFFILNIIVFSLLILSLLILINPLGYLIYISAFYIFIFSQSLLIVFSMDALKLYDKLPFKKRTTWIIIYGIISTYVFIFGILFNGINYDFSTNWRPIFSTNFLIVNMIFVTTFLVMPEVIFSLKLRKYIGDKIVRKKMWQFIFSFFLEFLMIYNLTLYNTWVDNYIYRALFPFFNLPIGFSAALLMYLSVGKTMNNNY